MSRLQENTKAFTLIELLIVVAIIAILAAIAVPNFLEAQIRSKVTRVRADMRAIATALEAYSVDNNTYLLLWPEPVNYSVVRRYNHYFWEHYMTTSKTFSIYCTLLTTPVAYMGSRPAVDPFTPRGQGDWDYNRFSSFWYTNFQGAYKDRDKQLLTNDGGSGLYFHPALQPLTMVRITGPDGPTKTCAWMMTSPGPSRRKLSSLQWLSAAYPNLSDGSVIVYDPTNGTTSEGSIIHTSAGFLGN